MHTLKKIVGATVMTAAVTAPVAVVAAPAEAACFPAYVCGTIKHYSPDDGYDPAIIIRCDFGEVDTKKFLEEGVNSTAVCGDDTDEVWVRLDEEIWCKYPADDGTSYWALKFDAHGWHKIGDTWNDGGGCTLRRD